MIKEVERALELKKQGLSNTKIGATLKDEFKVAGFTSATLHSYGNVKDIIEELQQKQMMLNVTSSNLHHAEDGYEYIQQEWVYSKAIYFIYGMGFLMSAIVVFGEFFAKISLLAVLIMLLICVVVTDTY